MGRTRSQCSPFSTTERPQLVTVPPLVDTISSVSQELSPVQFIVYAYNAITGKEMDETRVLAAVQAPKTKLLDRLKAAQSQEEDFHIGAVAWLRLANLEARHRSRGSHPMERGVRQCTGVPREYLECCFTKAIPHNAGRPYPSDRHRRRTFSLAVLGANSVRTKRQC